METLKKIVTNQYFPAGAVLTAVLLFWAVALLGGLSLLNNNQPPLTTLTWMLFVYVSAVLTPFAGILAAVDLVRRWRGNHAAEAAGGREEAPASEPDSKDVDRSAAYPVPVQDQPGRQQRPATEKPVRQKPAQKKSGPKKAA